MHLVDRMLYIRLIVEKIKKDSELFERFNRIIFLLGALYARMMPEGNTSPIVSFTAARRMRNPFEFGRCG